MNKITGYLLILTMLITCLLPAVTVQASGLFPTMDEMLGVSMPSLCSAVHRAADEISVTEEGEKQTFANFTVKDYLAFGQYLGAVGATMESYTYEDGMLSTTILANGSRMSFYYNTSEKIGEVFYPAGTREETEATNVKKHSSILPPFGGIMPSARYAIDRAPDAEENIDGGILQVFNEFSDDEYLAFSFYLGMVDAKLKDYKIEKGTLSAEIELQGYYFSIKYDWKIRNLSVFYPYGTIPETEKWNILIEGKSILPAIQQIGRELPNISQAIERKPSQTEKLENGDVKETYIDFSEADYNTFSQYLKKSECKVDNYSTENGIINIELSNITGSFVFSYDALHHEAKIVYPANTRVEKAWTPAPKPTAFPAPTEYAVTVYYSENECWLAAETYFKNLAWKNPDSLTIHGHTSSYDSSNGQYIFTIDYSAMNGFGGYNREFYWISVSAVTGKVIFGFGNE